MRGGNSYTATCQVYFSPHDGCTDAIVHHLVGAKKRSVTVRAILDKSQCTEKYCGATFLFNAGIPIVIDDKCAIAHSKVMLIDGQTVISGSFNFTEAAEEQNLGNRSSCTALPWRPGIPRTGKKIKCAPWHIPITSSTSSPRPTLAPRRGSQRRANGVHREREQPCLPPANVPAFADAGESDYLS